MTTITIIDTKTGNAVSVLDNLEPHIVEKLVDTLLQFMPRGKYLIEVS